MYINNLGHMTKMAAMPIYGKNPSKIIFSETNRLISRKLGVRHLRPAGTGTPLRGLSVKRSSVSVERPGYQFAVLGN